MNGINAMGETLSPIPIAPERVLKIEEVGDSWKNRLKPKIRLSGRWLEKAGFNPGGKVRVISIRDGEIVLRAVDRATRADCLVAG